MQHMHLGGDLHGCVTCHVWADGLRLNTDEHTSTAAREIGVSRPGLAIGGMFARRAPGAHSARARRTAFLLTIPTSAPDLPSHGEAPQVDHVALQTFPTKHVA